MKIALYGLTAATVLAFGTATGGTAAHEAQVTSLTPVQYHAETPRQYRAEQRAATIDQREAILTERIQRGRQDGRLTQNEARRLQRELREIRQKERAFLANDGRIGPREYDQLYRDLDRLAANVRHQLRDEQRYYW